MIAITHAYSRQNAGDGLLLDLTLARLARLGVGADECVVYALDAQSFGDLPRVRKVGTPLRRLSLDLLPATRALVQGASPRTDRMQQQFGDVDGIVAVGGGYLRTKGLINSLGTMMNHLPQLRAAARSSTPSFYMPQSIGPLRGPVGRAVVERLSQIDVVCVRDDLSVEELSAQQVTRYPDLAVLALAEELPPRMPSAQGTIILVARDLPRAPSDYRDRLRALAARLGDVVWAVQTEGEGAKSDRRFYDALGVRSGGRLIEILRDRPGATVVSVRLHGALQALMAGSAAVHLGYERKSWSVYADLGLNDYVHDARRFDPDTVASQLAALRERPSMLWDEIAMRVPSLLERSEALTAHLRSVLQR